MEKKLYLIGFRFGIREVIGYDPDRPNYRICICSCGSVDSVNTQSIKNGTANGCRKCSDDGKRQSLVGTKNGKLTVIQEYSKVINGKVEGRLICQCDCGNIVDIIRDEKSRTKSCGCSRIVYKDKERHAAIYVSWRCMMQRCYNPKHENYKYYGKAGVYVFKRWHKFANFYEDLKETWFQGATIDRFPVCGGNYLIDNVRWATPEQQNRNKTTSRFTEQDIIDIRNSGLSQTELAKKYNVGSGSISRIINNKRWANI